MVNRWVKYVKEFKKKNNIEDYGQALRLAGPSYRKMCGVTKKKSPAKKMKKRSKHKKTHKKKNKK